MSQAKLPEESLAGVYAQTIAHKLYLDNKECEGLLDTLKKFEQEVKWAHIKLSKEKSKQL